MEKNVLNTDLTGKVAVVTGAGGVLCSEFAKVLARAGAKVALLNRTESKAQKFADEITAEGGIAKAYGCNVLDKAQVYEVAERVQNDLGPCDILINGAGGNHTMATTDKEYYEDGDIVLMQTENESSAAVSPDLNIALIGEPVTMGSLAAALWMERGVLPKVLCPLEQCDDLLTGYMTRIVGEEDVESAVHHCKVVIADPLYQPICPPDAQFVPLPHEAFSGRVFQKTMPNLLMLEPHSLLEGVRL